MSRKPHVLEDPGLVKMAKGLVSSAIAKQNLQGSNKEDMQSQTDAPSTLT